MLCAMNKPKQPATLPLDYATELSMEIHLMRGECCAAAEGILAEDRLDAVGLEECAQLDDALGKAQRILHATIQRITEARMRRKKKASP